MLLHQIKNWQPIINMVWLLITKISPQPQPIIIGKFFKDIFILLLFISGELANKRGMIVMKKFCIFNFKELWVKELLNYKVVNPHWFLPLASLVRVLVILVRRWNARFKLTDTYLTLAVHKLLISPTCHPSWRLFLLLVPNNFHAIYLICFKQTWWEPFGSLGSFLAHSCSWNSLLWWMINSCRPMERVKHLHCGRNVRQMTTTWIENQWKNVQS